MECPKCGLNNMPGSAVCFQCGAPLTSGPEKAPTYPPRAAKSGLQEGIKREVLPRSRSSRAREPRELANPYIEALRDFLGSFGTSRHVSVFFRAIGRGLLSVVPGLGQFINRQWRKGLIFLVAIPALVAFLVFRYNSSIFNWVLTLAVVTLFASVFDAALYSIPAETRKTFQIPHFVSLACFVAAVFFLAAMLFFNELNRLYLFASIRQNWADPKLSQGEVIIVDRGAYAVEAPRRGDYVVAGGGAQMGKVVGLPGEEVELRDGKVFVGGSALPEAQYGYRELVDPRMRHFVLPGDGYLILESFERYSIVIPAARHHFSGRIIGVYSPSENRRRIGGQER